MSILAVPRSRGATWGQSRSEGRTRRTIGKRSLGQAAPDLRPMASPGATLTIQPKLVVGASNDRFELEADRVADEVMRLPELRVSGGAPEAGSAPSTRVQRTCRGCEEDLSSAPVTIQRMCPECDEELHRQPMEEVETEETVRAEESPGHLPEVAPHVGARIEGLRGKGRPLAPSLREFFEPRFGRDLSTVRIHTHRAGTELAGSINARAFTSGRDVVFGQGQYAPGTRAGKHLLAHELTHVVQQRAPASRGLDAVRRSPCDNEQIVGTGATAIPRLENRPSAHGDPCACIVFVHNNETNARRAAETLHAHCRYNLAIIQPGTGRNVAVPGQGRKCDPNELFPREVFTACTADPAACERYVADHNNLEATQRQFFLAVRECSDGFRLPTVALHNNTITASEAIRAFGRDHRLAALMENVERGEESGRESLENLRSRLESLSEGGEDLTRLLGRRDRTNIFRWCTLPEIVRCHVGDPWRPDHVVWTTNPRDYATLSQLNINVVLQAGLAAAEAEGGESSTDLSTLFLRLGADARFINIETPIAPTTPETRRSNMAFILTNLSRLGLLCCDEGSGGAAPTNTDEG